MRNTRALLAFLSACKRPGKASPITAPLAVQALATVELGSETRCSHQLLARQQLPSHQHGCLCPCVACQFSTTSQAAVGSSMDTEASLGDSEHLSEKDFHRHADHSLGELFSSLEDVIEEAGLPDADLEYSQGVMTIDLGKPGTYVINKQSPNKQLWMSSPVSGPARYDWSDGLWVYKRDGHVMTDKLEDELKKLLKLKDIDLEPPPIVGYGPDVT